MQHLGERERAPRVSVANGNRWCKRQDTGVIHLIDDLIGLCVQLLHSSRSGDVSSVCEGSIGQLLADQHDAAVHMAFPACRRT